MSRSTAGALLALLAALTLLAAGCGSSDGSGSGPGAKAKHDAQADEDAKGDASTGADDDADDGSTDATDPAGGDDLPPIQITTPASFATVSKSMVLAGTASVSEGTVAWAIYDASQKAMVSGTTTATCGAPCRGKFRVAISLAKVPLGSWELHAWSPNMADGSEGEDPHLHDTLVPITVAAKLDPDAPAADEPPPGGVPNSPAG